MTTNENNPVAPIDPPLVEGGGSNIDDVTSPEQLEIESGGEAPEAPVAPPEPDPTVQGNAMGAQGAPQELPGQQPLPGLQPQQDPSYTPDQIREMQERNTQYEKQQWEQQLGQQAARYKVSLENEGIAPDTADQLARSWMQQQAQQEQINQEYSTQLGNQEGRIAAAIHFSQESGSISADQANFMRDLLKEASPDAMRQKANQIQSIKAKDARIAELEQGTVPPQNFDNSQGSPDASASNDRLVDAYNNGDRSPAAVEAARRMTFGS